MESNYLQSALKEFSYYKSLGEKAIAQVSDENLTFQHNAESNSLAMIVRHLEGNMLSRWTDFLHSDGEKAWRQRDAEFESVTESREQVMQRWERGWKCVFNAIEPLKEEDLRGIVYIRNQGHTVTEAINRQIAHYAYHVGQMVFLSKLFAGEQWQTLSIARNKSADYNREKFSEEKKRGHFTDGRV